MVKRAFVNGIGMDYAEFGSGSGVMVILPGLSVRNVTADAEALEQTFKIFTNDYKIYLFDRRNNMGESYSVEEMAEDTFSVMKHVGIMKANIFGVSQGGMIAMCIAANHPEAVERMVLGSTASEVNDNIISVCDGWIKAAKERRRGDLAESFLKAVYSEGAANAWRKGFLSLSGTFTDEELDRFSVLAESVKSFNITDKLGFIKAQTLVIGCEGDRVVGGQASLDIAEKLNCGVYMYDDRYGHGVYDEAPDYRKRIFNFFSSDKVDV